MGTPETSQLAEQRKGDAVNMLDALARHWQGDLQGAFVSVKMYEYRDKGPFGSSPARLPKANDPVAMLKMNDDKLGTSLVVQRISV
jgi:hypothetical protein